MKRPKYYFPLLIVILLSLFLRFFLLTHQSLWYDEGMSLYYVNGMSLQETLSRILGREAGDKYQPLYYLMLFCWRSVFGVSEFALRSLSAFLGVGSVIVIFFTVLRLYGRKHAIWSSLILGLSSFGVYYSQETRAYALLLFLAAVQLYLFSRALSDNTSRQLVSQLSFAILTAIGLLAVS